MTLEQLKKDYQSFLKDTGKVDTEATKNQYKMDCLNWFIEFYGVGSDEVLLINKELQKF